MTTINKSWIWMLILVVQIACPMPILSSGKSPVTLLAEMNASILDKERAIKAFDVHVGQEERIVLAQTVIKDADWQIRKAALLKLREVSLEDKACHELLFDTAIKASRDSEGLVRSTACAILRYQSNDANAVTLVDVLRHEFELERDERGAKTDLRQRLGKTWWRDSVVRICVESLIYMGKSRTQAVEMRYRDHPNGDLGYALVYVLYRLGQKPDVEKLMTAVFDSSSEWIRMCAIRSLGEIGDKRAIPMLKDCLDDGFQIKTKEMNIFYPIRDAARRALDEIETGHSKPSPRHVL